MSDSLTPNPDLELPNADQASLAAWLAGTYESAWQKLAFAAYSAVYSAAHATDHVLRTVQKIVEKETPAAERTLLIDWNYHVRMFGACLGAITLCAFSIESFLRLCHAVGHESASRTKTQRAAGFTPQQIEEFTEFDPQPFEKRLQTVRRLIDAPKASTIEDNVLSLVRFRNSIAHDEPILFTVDVELRATQARHQRKRRDIGSFVPLNESRRPVRLSHVLQAVTYHDDLVSHFLSKARRPGWRDGMLSFVSLSSTIREHDQRSGWWPAVERTSGAWEEGPETQLRASPEDEQNYLQSLRLRRDIKLVT